MQTINYFGEEKIIIVTVAINLLTLILGVYTGIIDCMQPLVCQYHAENNLHSVIKAMRIGLTATVVVSLMMIFAGMIFADFLPTMFGVKDKILADEAAVAMRYFLPFTIFLGCTQMLGNYYIYIEKMNYGAFIKILMLLILPLHWNDNRRTIFIKYFLARCGNFICCVLFDKFYFYSKSCRTFND